jgi:hypothetical protein
MKKLAKIITTLIVLLLILILSDRFSSSSKSSLFLPQSGETRDIIYKQPPPTPKLRSYEEKYTEKISDLNKNPTKILSIEENGQHLFNYGRWIKITISSELYPPPYYVFENNDYLISFKQNIFGKFYPNIDIKYRAELGDSWYTPTPDGNNKKIKITLVSKNVTVKTPKQIFVHCIETKQTLQKNYVEFKFYAPSQFLIKDELENIKTNTVISIVFLNKTYN